MDDILAKLKALVDALSIAQANDPALKVAIILGIRIFNIGEAYQALAKHVKLIKDAQQFELEAERRRKQKKEL